MSYQFKATNLITQKFDAENIHYFVINSGKSEQIWTPYAVPNGPAILVRFISSDDDNDVSMRVYGVISEVSEDRRERASVACNMINNEIRYMKFYVDSDGDIEVEYDFPVETSDDCVGAVAKEMFTRSMINLKKYFCVLSTAVYTDDAIVIPD